MRKVYQIEVSEDKVISCFEDESILSAMSKNYCDIVCGCFGGGCGQCIVQVLEGSYTVFKKMSKAYVEKESSECLLACCIKPTSDMKLRIL